MKYITRTITAKKVRFISIALENGQPVSNVLGEEIMDKVPGPRGISNWKEAHEIPAECNVVVDVEEIENVYRMPVDVFIANAELVTDAEAEE